MLAEAHTNITWKKKMQHYEVVQMFVWKQAERLALKCTKLSNCFKNTRDVLSKCPNLDSVRQGLSTEAVVGKGLCNIPCLRERVT